MINIKDIQGNIILSVPITESAQKVEELMSNDYIQLSWNSNSSNSLPLGSYIEHEGEIYSLLEPYTPSQKNEAEYVYTPLFKSRVMAWGKKPFFFYSGDSKEPDWTLTSNPADFMRCICDSILEETGESWSYSIDASLPASASLSFTSVDILSGLNQIAGAFETEWFADKSTNTIYLGLLSHGSSVTLEVGKNINVPSVQGSKEGYYTRFYAFGSTRNITQDYEGSNTNNLVNKRLTLDPAKYPNGYKDIREGLSKGEIFSKVLIFDEVYPSANLSISGVRNRLMYRLDSNGDKIQVGTDGEGNPIYDQYAIWYFRIEGFDFDVTNIIEGYKLSVSFQSGALQGREFELKYYEKDTTITSSDGLKFEAKAGDYEIHFIEEGSYIIPSLTGLIPSDGDGVILFNIKMPSEYTQSAYIQLEEELDKAIARMTSDLNNYTFKSNPVAFNDNNPNLSIGRSVRFVNGDYSYNTRVIKLVTHLDFPIEQDITIGNEKVKGNTQQLKEEVASANKDLNLLAVFNDMTQSIQQSYNRTQQMMLDGFAAIKNIWQLKETSDGRKYAWSAFDVVTQQGITMYADNATLNLPSIYAGIPIDNSSIYWEETTNEDGSVARILKAKVGSGEGGSDTMLGDLKNVGEWANAIATEDRIMVQKKDSDQWVSLSLKDLGTASFENVKESGEGNAFTSFILSDDKKTLTFVKGDSFTKKADFDTLNTKVTDFLEGSDTDGIINKWKELEAFLEGMKQSDDLATILATKWTKDDAKIANWDAAFSWGDHSKAGYSTKTYVDETFVTLKTEQTIIGKKDFTTGGLFVNGSQIVYDSTNGYWKLDGDLLVTGAITMFANEGKYTPSTIMDAIATDNLNLKVVNGVLTFVGQTGGGVADSVAWNKVTDKPTWITETKPEYKFSEIKEKPTTIAEYGITDAKISNGTITLGSTTITPLTQSYGDGRYVNLSQSAQTITVAKTFNEGTWILAKNESGVITNRHMSNSTWGSTTKTYGIRNGIDFGWQGTHWIIGNIRGLSVESYGFGIGSLNSDGYLNPDFRITSGAAYVNDNEVIHKGNYSSYLGYIGKTQVQKESGVQSLTGIGNITPDTGSTYGLGTSSSRWSNLYTDKVTINGISIYKSSTGVLRIDGDVVLSGALTMFGTDSVNTSTIMDGVAVDGTTIIKSGNKLMLNPDLKIGGGGINSLKVKLGTVEYDGVGTTDVVVSLPAYPTVPTSLKNPNKLTVTLADGSTKVEYDGSTAKSITMTRLWKSSEVTSATSDEGSITPLAMNQWTTGKFPLKDGTGATGTWGVSISGNANTATTASKLSTLSKTAWGQTYWTSGGVPTSISGDMSNVGNIGCNTGWKYKIGTNAIPFHTVYSNIISGGASNELLFNLNESAIAKIQSGSFIPYNTVSCSLGDSTHLWKGIYLGYNNSSVYNSNGVMFGNGYGRIGCNSDGSIGVLSKGYIYLRTKNPTSGSISSVGVDIDTSGNLLATGGITMYGSSDKRLKKNIRTFQAGKELLSLGGVYQFEYEDNEIRRNGMYKGTHVGMIYQNVKGTILDKMCYEREDGYGALNYLDSSFISLLAGVGVEHETRIQRLERENEELRKEIEQLKSV